MGLSEAKIKELLALPKRGGGGGRSKGPDTNVRDFQTWFKLASKIVDESTGELIKCDNPNCQDPRALSGNGQGIVCVEINGQNMCRYCFLDGWLLISEGQQEIAVDAN